MGSRVYLTALDEQRCSFEVSIGDHYGLLAKDEIAHLFSVLWEKMAEVR